MSTVVKASVPSALIASPDGCAAAKVPVDFALPFRGHMGCMVGVAGPSVPGGTRGRDSSDWLCLLSSRRIRNLGSRAERRRCAATDLAPAYVGVVGRGGDRSVCLFVATTLSLERRARPTAREA